MSREGGGLTKATAARRRGAAFSDLCTRQPSISSTSVATTSGSPTERHRPDRRVRGRRGRRPVRRCGTRTSWPAVPTKTRWTGLGAVDDYFGQEGNDTIESTDDRRAPLVRRRRRHGPQRLHRHPGRVRDRDRRRRRQLRLGGRLQQRRRGDLPGRARDSRTASTRTATAATTSTSTATPTASRSRPTATTPNAAIRPGALEVKGNAVDENCDRGRSRSRCYGRSCSTTGRSTARARAAAAAGPQRAARGRGSCSAAAGAAARQAARDADRAARPGADHARQRRLRRATLRPGAKLTRRRSPPPRPPGGHSRTRSRTASCRARTDHVPRAGREREPDVLRAALLLAPCSRCSRRRRRSAGMFSVDPDGRDRLQRRRGRERPDRGLRRRRHDPLHPLRGRRRARAGAGCDLSADGADGRLPEGRRHAIMLDLGDGDDVAAVSPTSRSPCSSRAATARTGCSAAAGSTPSTAGRGNDNIVARDGRAERGRLRRRRRHRDHRRRRHPDLVRGGRGRRRRRRRPAAG